MKASTPENTRVYAIGDIHGCADLLKTLMDQITAFDAMRPRVTHKILVFLGDYIDRGPETRQVIDLLLHDLPCGYDPIFLKGNHEDMLLEAFEGERAADFWLRNGGHEAIASYGLDDLNIDTEMNAGKLLEKFGETLPFAHLDFLNGLQLSYQCGDYFFVHAGIHPDRALDDQEAHDLMWIRDRFLFSENDFGKVIIHGHTPAKDVDVANNQIGIDTAAVYGGKLTALMLDGPQREYLYASASKK